MMFMKKPCKNCPYLRGKTYLHPERGVDLAELVYNEYNSFICHETLEDDDEGEDGFYIGDDSLVCAGFLSLQHIENGSTLYDEDGFMPSDAVYDGVYEMMDAYERGE